MSKQKRSNLQQKSPRSLRRASTSRRQFSMINPMPMIRFSPNFHRDVPILLSDHSQTSEQLRVCFFKKISKLTYFSIKKNLDQHFNSFSLSSYSKNIFFPFPFKSIFPFIHSFIHSSNQSIHPLSAPTPHGDVHPPQRRPVGAEVGLLALSPPRSFLGRSVRSLSPILSFSLSFSFVNHFIIHLLCTILRLFVVHHSFIAYSAHTYLVMMLLMVILMLLPLLFFCLFGCYCCCFYLLLLL